MGIIKDGSGDGYDARVDSTKRLHTNALTQTEIADAVHRGKAWNLGTGNITLSSDSASGLLYVKNTGTSDLTIDLYVILTQASTGGSGQGVVEILRNPTSGTAVTAGTTITATNMNFGSNSQPDATMVAGAEAKTFSGHDDTLRSLVTASNRLLLGILTELPQGSSVGIRYTPPTGNSSMVVEVITEIYEEA